MFLPFRWVVRLHWFRWRRSCWWGFIGRGGIEAQLTHDLRRELYSCAASRLRFVRAPGRTLAGNNWNGCAIWSCEFGGCGPQLLPQTASWNAVVPLFTVLILA